MIQWLYHCFFSQMGDKLHFGYLGSVALEKVVAFEFEVIEKITLI